MFDCTLINDELDILEIRLNILNPVVEKFVIVESDCTHSGKHKPLHFFENRQRFAQFEHKIIHLVHPFIRYDDQSQKASQAWTNEQAQRNKFVEILNTQTPSDNLCFVSDVDEIPRPDKLLEAVNLYKTTGMPISLEMDFCCYFANYCFNPDKFRGPFLYNPFEAQAVHAKFGQTRYDPSYFRWHMCDSVWQNDFPVIKDAGWHFSFVGGLDLIQKKLSSYAHVECDNDNDKSEIHIIRSMIRGKHLGLKLQGRLEIKPHSYLPEYLQNNKEKYSKFIL